MAHQYCTETQFYRYARKAAPYANSDRLLTSWVVHSGSVYRSDNCGSITILKADGVDLGAAEANLQAVDAANEWYYDSAADVVYYYSSTDPDELEMLASEDHATYMAWLLQAASELVDRALDATHQIPFPYDKSGNYPEIIIQATAYQAAYIVCIEENEVLAEKYANMLENDEGRGIFDGLRKGKIKMPYEVDYDSSRGEIKEVSVDGGLKLIRTWGKWSGSRHDTIKVIITLAGAVGTATFSTYEHDTQNDLPKNLLMVENEVIDGSLQHLGGGLYGQFLGDSADTATLNDEWEIDVWNYSEPLEHGIRTIPLTRS